MKKVLLLVFVISMIGKLNAQKNPNVVKLTPLTFAKGQLLMVHYERNIWKKMSIGIGVAPIFRAPISFSTLDYVPTDFNMGIAIDPELRWYAKSNDAMDGFFVGFYNSNRFSSWTSTTDGNSISDILDLNYDWTNQSFNVDVTNQKYIFGLQLGTQKMMSENISIDFYSGLGVSINKTTATGYNVNTKSDYVDENYGAGINVRLNLAVGYRF